MSEDNTGQEIERLLVRLIGDATSYQKMLREAAAGTESFREQTKKLTDIEKEQQQLLRQGEMLTRSLETATEAYHRRLGEVQRLMSAQVISGDTYHRAIHKINQEFDAEKANNPELLAARETHNSLIKEGEALTKSLASATEEYQEQITRIHLLLEEGVITQDTYNRALEQVQTNLVHGQGYRTLAEEAELASRVIRENTAATIQAATTTNLLETMNLRAAKTLTRVGGLLSMAGLALSGFNEEAGITVLKMGAVVTGIGMVVQAVNSLRNALLLLQRLALNPISLAITGVLTVALTLWTLHTSAQQEAVDALNVSIEKHIRLLDTWASRPKPPGYNPSTYSVGKGVELEIPGVEASDQDRINYAAQLQKRRDEAITQLHQANEDLAHTEKVLAQVKKEYENSLNSKFRVGVGKVEAPMDSIKPLEERIQKDKEARDEAIKFLQQYNRPNWKVENGQWIKGPSRIEEAQGMAADAEANLKEKAAQGARVDMIQRWIKSLEDERASLGKTAGELAYYKAMQEGATEAIASSLQALVEHNEKKKAQQDALVSLGTIEKNQWVELNNLRAGGNLEYTNALRQIEELEEKAGIRREDLRNNLKEIDRLKDSQKDFQKGQQIKDQYLTPMEKYVKQVTELQRLYDVGALGVKEGSGLETLHRALAGARDELDKIQEKSRIKVKFEVQNVDAVLAGSKEHLMRLVAFRDAMTLSSKLDGAGSLLGSSTVANNTPIPMPSNTPIDRGSNKEATAYLKELVSLAREHWAGNAAINLSASGIQ